MKDYQRVRIARPEQAAELELARGGPGRRRHLARTMREELPPSLSRSACGS